LRKKEKERGPRSKRERGGRARASSPILAATGRKEREDSTKKKSALSSSVLFLSSSARKRIAPEGKKKKGGGNYLGKGKEGESGRVLLCSLPHRRKRRGEEKKSATQKKERKGDGAAPSSTISVLCFLKERRKLVWGKKEKKEGKKTLAVFPATSREGGWEGGGGEKKKGEKREGKKEGLHRHCPSCLFRSSRRGEKEKRREIWELWGKRKGRKTTGPATLLPSPIRSCRGVTASGKEREGKTWRKRGKKPWVLDLHLLA